MGTSETNKEGTNFMDVAIEIINAKIRNMNGSLVELRLKRKAAKYRIEANAIAREIVDIENDIKLLEEIKNGIRENSSDREQKATGIHELLQACLIIAKDVPVDSLDKASLEQIEMDIRELIQLLQWQDFGIKYVLPAIYR